MVVIFPSPDSRQCGACARRLAAHGLIGFLTASSRRMGKSTKFVLLVSFPILWRRVSPVAGPAGAGYAHWRKKLWKKSLEEQKAFHPANAGQSPEGDKERKQLFFASLCALASLREIVYFFTASPAVGTSAPPRPSPRQGRKKSRREVRGNRIFWDWRWSGASDLFFRPSGA